MRGFHVERRSQIETTTIITEPIPRDWDSGTLLIIRILLPYCVFTDPCGFRVWNSTQWAVGHRNWHKTLNCIIAPMSNSTTQKWKIPILARATHRASKPVVAEGAGLCMKEQVWTLAYIIDRLQFILGSLSSETGQFLTYVRLGFSLHMPQPEVA